MPIAGVLRKPISTRMRHENFDAQASADTAARLQRLLGYVDADPNNSALIGAKRR